MLLANFNISCFRLKLFFVFIKLPKLSLPFLLWTFLPSCQAFEQRCFNVLCPRFSLREIFVSLVNGVKWSTWIHTLGWPVRQGETNCHLLSLFQSCFTIVCGVKAVLSSMENKLHMLSHGVSILLQNDTKRNARICSLCISFQKNNPQIST